GLVNAVVRPIAVILTFPFTLLTIGVFLLVVNAAMLGLVALLLPGFHISGFWAAFLAALIVSVTGSIGSLLIGSRAKVEIYSRKG
ncbi:MAG: phage holin family protein, partial [Gammaproteobacteria bacterium]